MDENSVIFGAEKNLVRRIHEAVFADSPFPVGCRETAQWVREIGAFFGKAEQADIIIDEQISRYKAEAKRLKTYLAGKRLMIVSYNHNVDWLIETAIAAVEGIRDAAVLLNGPTGCKFYHGALCDARMPRVDSLDPLRYSEPFYFGQPRVPATYLDGNDYVFGATEKLEGILKHVAQTKNHALIAVVNSPGAALIGDDLDRLIADANLPVPCMAVENPGFSTSFCEGFQQAAKTAVDALANREVTVQQKHINLIGVSLFQRYWEGDISELRRLLGLCGIRIHAVLCADTVTEAVETSGRAALNVGICAELAESLGRHLEKRFGTPLLIPSCGAPIGFDATEHFLSEVCRALGVDTSPAMAAVSRARRRAYTAISRFHTITGLPKGASFALKAEPSLALPLTRWLYTYLGMIPAAVYTTSDPSPFNGKLALFLSEIGCISALNPERISDMPQAALASGAVLARLESVGWTGAKVALSLPSGGRINVVPRAVMGATGALHLIEQLLNGLY
jgi:nitrogenase molybdenum-iron protein alpha/beta subunit